MLSLLLVPPATGPMSVLAVGAHPDDVEIGAGGTLLTLAACQPGMRVHYVVLTGPAGRQREARHAAQAFLAGADLTVQMFSLPEKRLPTAWNGVKDALEEVAAGFAPDVVLAPAPADAHQDHRTIAEIVPTVFRDQLVLGYEIPKWDGDLGRPSAYFPLSERVARRKIELLNKSFPSQRQRDWWDDEVFLGLARLRGVECRAPYAEAFTCTKFKLAPPAGE
ncbi:MAG TPA: PIG-L deacetylase family protein [Streptosporangiaceae bacterium]|nr:PIG-L deacetylase family protein [Streptosporangiaceae bacterium]